MIPRSPASSTASDVGAPTPTRIGDPARAAFCTSSNASRPLTQSTRSPSGRASSSSAQPTTLSIALWRPTSSRTWSSSPAAENSPVAWSPPVRSKVGWRRRSGSSASSARGIEGPPDTTGAIASTSSSAPLPQMPQDEVV